jgi:hypothetical protein
MPVQRKEPRKVECKSLVPRNFYDKHRTEEKKTSLSASWIRPVFPVKVLIKHLHTDTQMNILRNLALRNI